jgi:uncharacterized protein
MAIGVVALGAGIAGFAEGASEVEFPILALGLWAWTLPPQLAAPLAVFGALLGAVASLFALRGGLELRRVAPFAVGGLLGAPLGIFLLHNADPSRFRLAVGFVLTLYALFALAFRGSARFKTGGVGSDAFVGVLGGALGGFCGLAAAPPSVWTRLSGWKSEPRRATVRAFVIVVALATLAAYARTGAIEREDVQLFAVVAPVALIASLLGARFVRKRALTIGRLALMVALASGAAMLVVAVGALFRR